MALEKDMELGQIKRFLEEEVKEQIFLEIAPLLYIGQPVGGYFGVTRQILCLIDFFGALYCGYEGKKKKGLMIISETWKAEKFITKILGVIDSKYRDNGKVLYKMYRHGLVHLYQPKKIKQNNGRSLSWAIYKGARETHPETFDTNEGSFTIPNARHLEIVVDPRDSKKDLLTISITCLYKDLLTATDIYYRAIEEDKTDDLLNKWRSTGNAILEEEDYSLFEKGGEVND